MLMAGEIKLKVSGREVTAAGQQAIDALKTNNSFKQIGVALRDERPSIETLGRAAERLIGRVSSTSGGIRLRPELGNRLQGGSFSHPFSQSLAITAIRSWWMRRRTFLPFSSPVWLHSLTPGCAPSSHVATSTNA